VFSCYRLQVIINSLYFEELSVNTMTPNGCAAVNIFLPYFWIRKAGASVPASAEDRALQTLTQP